ncbi:MAG: hypothetical protein R6T91_02055 [Bacteroidales bacterium]
MNRNFLFVLLLSGIFFIACNVNTEDPVDMGYDYYPLKTNAYMIYEVDSIFWDDFYDPVKIDTSYYQVKEIVVEHIQDDQNKDVFLAERYIRPSDTADWKIDYVYTLQRESTKILKMVDNKYVIPFVFPPKAGYQWDVNGYNSSLQNIYEYSVVDDIFVIDNQEYSNTVTVEQQNLTTLISKNLAYEVYASQIGMVYKEVIDQDLNINTGEVESGVHYTYKLIDYGL